MLQFVAASFAAAGAMAALAPVIIHLLNRRRYRTVHWAAMDFLRHAVQRKSRRLKLRDLLLLLLRVACVLLFAFALARPYWSSHSLSGVDQPVHAIVVLDNSLSMAYQRLGGSLLDEAKTRIRALVENLPRGSAVSLLPACAFDDQIVLDPYRNIDDLHEALALINVVDQQLDISRVIALAHAAADRAPELLNKRVVLYGDQQQLNFRSLSGASAEGGKDAWGKLHDVRLVSIRPEQVDNAWVAELRLLDALADVNTDSTITATIRYDGPSDRLGTPVSLSVDDVPVGTQTIDLKPGQTQKLYFTHRFDLPIEPGEVAYATVVVSLGEDRLSDDDRRAVVVPVVSRWPIVFVDQYGATQESPENNLLGETLRWRRYLMADSGTDAPSEKARMKHMTIGQLDRDALKYARMVVLAGVENVSPTIVDLLREYVEQGGQLLIATGGRFDPASWQATAWRDGDGILPLPLDTRWEGVTLDEDPLRVAPFQLDERSLTHDLFQFEDQLNTADANELTGVLFFKTAVVQDTLDAWQGWKQREDERRAKKNEPAKVDPSAPPTVPPTSWLAWRDELNGSQSTRSKPAENDTSWYPEVLARFTNGLPFAAQRSIGQGRVVFMASGVQPNWNTLMTGYGAVLFDRIVRESIDRTLPRRNLAPTELVQLPIAARDRALRLTLSTPDRRELPLWVDATGESSYAIAVRHLDHRGIYRLRAYRDAEPMRENTPAWTLPLAIQGPASESELRYLNEGTFAQRFAQSESSWHEADDPLQWSTGGARGHNWWRVLLALTMLGLIGEFGLVNMAGRPEPAKISEDRS